MADKLMVGGQAVIEGVMMRGPKFVATAVREPSGKISVQTKPVSSIGDRWPILKKPLLRGVVSLYESLILGIKSLSYSAQMAGEEDEQLSDKELAGTIAFAFCMAIVLFVAIPTGAARLFHSITEDPVFLNLMEGVLRLVIFLAYIFGISRMEGIYRVFQYHGAEHKCINCIEKGRPLTVHNVMRSSRLHKRCGTSFIFFVMLVSIVLFFFIQVDNVAEKVILRILLMPVVAGISYEIIRLAGRTDNVFIKILSAPGMWIQRMTTREPDESMAEVAIASVEAVFDWKKYLQDTFGYEVDESWMKDDASAEPED